MKKFASFVFFFLITLGPAFAAPPASCASKFIGEWRHSGGNKGTLTADGRALCSEHAACQAPGTWTCSGNSMTYTTSMGSWVYTLMPDGSITANGGIARATRIGRAPAVAQKSAPAALNNAPIAAASPDAQKRPKTVRDCSGVSGKIDGVELKPMKCDDPPPKLAVANPPAKPQPAKPAAPPTSGTVAGSQRALEAIADISPEFKNALENAAVSLSRPNVDPSRFASLARENEPAPPPRRPPPQSAPAKIDTKPSEEAAVAPGLDELDPDDYARKCRDESMKSGLTSLAQDINAARRGRERDASYYTGKVALVNKVLKKCIRNILDKEIIEALYQSGIFEDLAGDPK